MNNISWKSLRWWEAVAVVLAGMTSPAIGSHYFTDFEGPVGPEWSSQQTAVTSIGNRRFLGQFFTDTLSLSLSSLPAHQAVTISFDLFVQSFCSLFHMASRNDQIH